MRYFQGCARWSWLQVLSLKCRSRATDHLPMGSSPALPEDQGAHALVTSCAWISLRLESLTRKDLHMPVHCRSPPRCCRSRPEAKVRAARAASAASASSANARAAATPQQLGLLRSEEHT